MKIRILMLILLVIPITVSAYWHDDYPAETVADNADKVMIYDDSAKTTKIMTREDFIAAGLNIGDVLLVQDVGTCSDTTYTDQTTCEANSGTWTAVAGIATDFILRDEAPTVSGQITADLSNDGIRIYSNGSVHEINGTGGAGSSSYVTPPPTYSDEACTAGQYAFSTSTGYVCVSSGDWNTFALTDWNNPAPTYSLTLTITDSDGDDTVTVDGTDYTTSQTITGLDSATETLTGGFGSAGTNDTVVCTGSAVSGTAPNYTIDMSDSDESAECTFSTAGGYGTTVFSYDFNVADNSDPTSVGAPTDVWSSVYDVNNDGAITSNEFLITINDTDPIQLRKTITATDYTEVTFTVNFSRLDYMSNAGARLALLSIRNAGGGVYDLNAKMSTASGSLDTIYSSYATDAGTVVDSTAFSFSAATNYTFVVKYEAAQADGDNDGVASVTVNGTSVFSVVDLDNDTKGSENEVRVGITYVSEAVASAGSASVDDVVVKTP